MAIFRKLQLLCGMHVTDSEQVSKFKFKNSICNLKVISSVKSNGSKATQTKA